VAVLLVIRVGGFLLLRCFGIGARLCDRARRTKSVPQIPECPTEQHHWSVRKVLGSCLSNDVRLEAKSVDGICQIVVHFGSVNRLTHETPLAFVSLASSQSRRGVGSFLGILAKRQGCRLIADFQLNGPFEEGI
jgi:hypothetical protein